MVPGHDFGRYLAAITRPHRHWRQQVDHVDLARNKRLDHLRPTAQQHRALGLYAFGFEQAIVVRNQQGRGIGDGQVANANGRIRLGSRPRLQAGQHWQSARCGEHGAEF